MLVAVIIVHSTFPLALVLLCLTHLQQQIALVLGTVGWHTSRIEHLPEQSSRTASRHTAAHLHDCHALRITHTLQKEQDCLLLSCVLLHLLPCELLNLLELFYIILRHNGQRASRPARHEQPAGDIDQQWGW